MPEQNEIYDGMKQLINHLEQICAPTYVIRKMLREHCMALINNKVAKEDDVLWSLIALAIRTPDE